MVFSSVVFLYVFFPAFLVGYFVLPKRVRNLYLLACSLFFYMWGEQHLVLVMLTSTAVDYLAGRVIAAEFARLEAQGVPPGRKERTPRQKAALWASISVNILMLGIFKYFNFAADNVIALLDLVGLQALIPAHVVEIILPLGISFYTFQSMSYTIDVYRRQVGAARNFGDFACYVTMFPQLIAGPIVRYRDVEREIRQRSTSLEDFSDGIRQFLIGLGKKMLIANILAQPADQIFALPHGEISAMLAFTGTLFFLLQLYYDFAGYSDMAIGMGRMLGFHFPVNFRYPYISRTIAEFWTRWHITLSTWLRDYLFVSMGGYRKGRGRAYFNLMVTFVLCGFWHGASWNFILFGFITASCIVFERMVKANKRWFFNSAFGNLYFLVIMFANMAIFRAVDMEQAWTFLSAMGAPWAHPTAAYRVEMFLNPEVLMVLAAALVGCFPVFPWVREHYAAWTGTSVPREAIGLTVSIVFFAGILLSCALKLAAGTYNPFIYFRF